MSEFIDSFIKITIIELLLGIVIGSIYYIHHLEKLDPVAEKVFEHEPNPALNWTCKETSYGILRCRNWEMLCYRFPETTMKEQLVSPSTQCYVLNLPKQLHWKKN